MRISAITNFAYGATVVLTAMSAAAFLLSADRADKERQAVEQHLQLDDLGDELELAAEERTDEARLYVVTGETRHLDAFNGRESEEKRRESAVSDLMEAGLSALERDTIAEIVRHADDLDVLEENAVKAYQTGDRDGARQTLFGTDHDRLQAAVLETVTRFLALVQTRTGDALQDARERADTWALIAKIMLGLTALLFLAVLYFVLWRRVAIPLVRMTGIVSRLARQDYGVEVPDDRRNDEIGEMNKAISIFRENGLERDRLDAERRRDQLTKDLILQMMHRLQACQTQTELADVVALFAPQIFPQLSGELYVMNDSRTLLSGSGIWPAERQQRPGSFAASSCWAIRRGRPHVSGAEHSDISCQHIEAGDMTCICVPLTAQGDTVGLMCFDEQVPSDETARNAMRLYLELIAENIGLAIANLELRDRLTKLALRDALTGLLNRRSLDEALSRDERSRSDATLACLMIDIDHFKRFNDEFGHDAGDEVMRHVAQVIAETAGETATAFRYGGEEFAVLAPGLDETRGLQLAERIRTAVAGSALQRRGRIIGAVTVSVGMAIAPSAGRGNDLLNRADTALLAAKAAGRNRVMFSMGTLADERAQQAG
jgi:diguanylate cyclase (GGDEF)-like protein